MSVFVNDVYVIEQWSVEFNEIKWLWIKQELSGWGSRWNPFQMYIVSVSNSKYLSWFDKNIPASDKLRQFFCLWGLNHRLLRSNEY